MTLRLSTAPLTPSLATGNRIESTFTAEASPCGQPALRLFASKRSAVIGIRSDRLIGVRASTRASCDSRAAGFCTAASALRRLHCSLRTAETSVYPAGSTCTNPFSASLLHAPVSSIFCQSDFSVKPQSFCVLSLWIGHPTNKKIGDQK